MPQVPGYAESRTMTPREPAAIPSSVISLPGGGYLDAGSIDGSNNPSDEIREGWWLGRVIATGNYVPCKRTRTIGAAATASAAVMVANASAFRVGDVIKIGGNAVVTIAAINMATNVITISTAQTWAAGDPVRTQDGGETAVGVNLDFQKMRGADGVTLAGKVTRVAIAGVFRREALLGDTDAILADPAALLTGIKILANGVPVR